MHRLDKATVPTPSCLVTPPSERRYATLKSWEMAEIRSALLTLQAHRCAYCERRTGEHKDYDGHVEHFLNQAGHEHLALDWDNLFWSCKDERTCGKNKDQCRNTHGALRRFVAADLINPGRDDPEDYLLFVSDGTVKPRPHLEGDDLRRAEETIRVFQLNESACLVKCRQDAIRPFLATVNQLLDDAPQILVPYVKRMLAEHADAPLGTAIQHILNSVIP